MKRNENVLHVDQRKQYKNITFYLQLTFKIYNMSTTYSFTYTADENGEQVENAGPAQMPAYVAKRLNGSKKRFKKKGTPAEREAAVEARRQAVLAEKKNKARKYIDKVESYARNAAAQKEGEENAEEDFSEKCDE